MKPEAAAESRPPEPTAPLGHGPAHAEEFEMPDLSHPLYDLALKRLMDLAVKRRYRVPLLEQHQRDFNPTEKELACGWQPRIVMGDFYENPALLDALAIEIVRRAVEKRITPASIAEGVHDAAFDASV